MGAIPTELKESNKYDKVVELVSKEKADEILAMDSDAIRKLLGDYQVSTENATNEVRSQIEYLKAKDVIKTLNGGLNDTLKPYKACAKLCLAVLEARGDNLPVKKG